MVAMAKGPAQFLNGAMRWRYCVLFALAMAGCVATPHPGPSIVGVWELMPNPDESYGISSTCHSTVEYRADGTFLTRNGDMEIAGHYNVETEGESTYYHEWDMRGNGRKSCQGLTSDFVIAHTRPKRRIVVESSLMKVYSLSSSTYFVFERRNAR